MSKHHPYPYRNGDALAVCDICGRQRYRSECRPRWDGLLCCLKTNCWDKKHNILNPLPVINDPFAIVDARPDQADETWTFVSDVVDVGLITAFQGPHNMPGSINGRVTFDTCHAILGHVDDAPNYAGL